MGFVGAGVANAALLWTESRRELEVSIHREKTRDHENWEPDVLSQVPTYVHGPATLTTALFLPCWTRECEPDLLSAVGPNLVHA